MRAPFAVEKNWQYLLGVKAYLLPYAQGVRELAILFR
jgi:hypothetical protein